MPWQEGASIPLALHQVGSRRIRRHLGLSAKSRANAVCPSWGQSSEPCALQANPSNDLPRRNKRREVLTKNLANDECAVLKEAIAKYEAKQAKKWVSSAMRGFLRFLPAYHRYRR